jgi:tetratricopeptide (TPR) repeat protein
MPRLNSRQTASKAAYPKSVVKGACVRSSRLVALRVLKYRSLSYLADGSPGPAYFTLMKARRLFPNAPGLCVPLAKAAMQLRDLAAAETWWERAIGEDPPNADNFLNLGTCRYRLNKVVEAIASYRGALEIDPDLQGARISLAIAYLAAECPSLALKEAEAQLCDAPGLVDLRFVRASALIQLGRAEEAIADLKWLDAANAKPAEAALLECEVNRALGDHEAALIVAAELCEAFPLRAAPLRCFRETFADFLRSAPSTRVNEFLTALGLPVPRTRLRADDAGRQATNRSTIDVVIPVHDGLDYLKACLDSILMHRTRMMGQIILVDDGCSQETRQWMRGFVRE